MRNNILLPVAAAFILSSVGAAANAYPSPSQMHKDGEIKDPVKADAAISKDMAKDARKNQHRARKDAEAAARKAGAATRKADEAAKAQGSS